MANFNSRQILGKSNDNGFGLHLTLDGYQGDRKRLSDMSFVFSVLDTIPSLLKMHKITTPYVVYYDGGGQPEDEGLSGMVLIAESHISIHTFPQKGFITADVYSCREFDTEATVKFFKKAFKTKEEEVNLIKRGLKFPKHMQSQFQSKI